MSNRVFWICIGFLFSIFVFSTIGNIASGPDTRAARKATASHASSKPMIPTLNELLDRLRSDVSFKGSCKELYRRVASGERHPTEPNLPDNVIVFACQAMTVLFAHAENHVDADDEISRLRAEALKLRRILAHVTGRIAIEAKEKAGYPDYVTQATPDTGASKGSLGTTATIF